MEHLKVFLQKGKTLARIEENLNINFRQGFRIEIMKFLSDIESEYFRNLESTFMYFDTYDDISNESRDDLIHVEIKLEMLKELGYINEDELESMKNYAESMRDNRLQKLEKEGEKDGN